MRVGGGFLSGGSGGGGGGSRRAEMEPSFPQGLVMFNHRLPPVASFARPAGPAAPPPQCVLAPPAAPAEPPPPPPPPAPDMTFKKEPAGSSAAFPAPRTPWGFLQPLVSIKQEKPADPDEQPPHHHYGGLFAGAEDRTAGLGGGEGGGHGVIQDLSVLHQQPPPPPAPHPRDALLGGGEEPKQDAHVKKVKRPKPESQGIKAKRKPSASSKPSSSSSSAGAGDGEGAVLSPSQKPHICDHCSAAFRSSYHLRRHVLIHTGERPFQCSQCSMGFIQKYLLQRHEKIHSREKPFGCDQCSMKFIQKYHMERHKRTHSGEKPYKCDTCQQYFSRTDRLLKHRRTCGEALAKGGAPSVEPGSANHSNLGNLAVLSQGHSSSSRRKAKAKSSSAAVESKEHGKAGKAGESQLPNSISMQSYSVEMPALSAGGGILGSGLDELQKRVPKLIFKKGSRKNPDKNYLNFVSPLPDMVGQKSLSGKPGGSLGIVPSASAEAISLLQSAGGKQGQLNSNYDDAMQFSKKRRYLPTATSNSAFSINVGHMVSQQSVIQSAGVSVLDSESPLSLMDSSALSTEIKSCHDKSGIPDEVLQSILDQYSNKSESQKEDPFTIPEPRVDLHTSGEHSELVQEENLSPGTQTPASDKASMLQEYSKYLQQAFEKSTNAGFTLGHGFQFVSLSSPLHNHTLFPEKQVYTTSPLECGFGQSVTSVLPSSLPKPPFGMLFGSQPGLYLSALDATHQQLTPSQELDDLIDSQKNLETSSAFQSSSQKLTSQKEQQKNLESSTSFQMPSQELASQIDPQKDIEPRTTYQIENFAQAFGSQFKSGSRVPMTFVSNSNGEVDHRVRTSVSDFSGYTNMMSDVSEPCSSTRVKTPTSQSYR
ncbi:zinc finger protein 281 [Saccopteryx leptura]|uniref:zinc finger protein 281 n=1 Tax=Saccopteryx leptura TaxID=249018 RepID=UPI00339D2041